MIPHLDSAYNLARWLAGNDHDAQDVAQEAVLRAFKYFHGFRDGNPRAWLLTIVRNTACNWLKANRSRDLIAPVNEELETMEDAAANPDLRINREATASEVRAAIAELPVEFRELVVLRELEQLSYKEIADVLEVPMGTVMSRLARARKQLQISLAPKRDGGNR